MFKNIYYRLGSKMAFRIIHVDSDVPLTGNCLGCHAPSTFIANRITYWTDTGRIMAHGPCLTCAAGMNRFVSEEQKNAIIGGFPPPTSQ